VNVTPYGLVGQGQVVSGSISSSGRTFVSHQSLTESNRLSRPFYSPILKLFCHGDIKLLIVLTGSKDRFLTRQLHQ